VVPYRAPPKEEVDPLTKAELIDQISGDADITKAAAGLAIDSMIEGISKSLRKGQKTTLVGFGTFSISKRKARTGRNPQTGETIKIKAKNVVRFKPGTELDRKVNRRR
jgi:DNA-binding protein HU-beta